MIVISYWFNKEEMNSMVMHINTWHWEPQGHVALDSVWESEESFNRSWLQWRMLGGERDERRMWARAREERKDPRDSEKMLRKK